MTDGTGSTGAFKRRTNPTLKVMRPAPPAIRHFTLQRVDQPGPAQMVSGGSAQVGSHTLNEVVIEEPTVSRFHCEILVDPDTTSRAGHLALDELLGR